MEEMKGYIFACLNAIKFYQNAYSSGLKEEFVSSCKNLNVGNLCRFRVFLDACMLALNKEKIDETFSSKCDFVGFMNHINNDSIKNYYISPEYLRDVAQIFFENETVKKKIVIPADKRVEIFYSSKSTPLDISEQIKIVRNAFAHSQYSSFMCKHTNGYLLGYQIDNADSDDQSRVESGMVISDVIHSLVLAFYSSYASIGIPCRQTFVNKYSMLNRENLEYYNLVNIKPNETSQCTYDGFFKDHPMKILSSLMNDGAKLFSYIFNNLSEFEISEEPLNNTITIDQMNGICHKYGYPSTGNLESDPYMQDVVRVITTPEYLISNVLTSVSYLNDAVIKYILTDNINDLLSVIAEIQSEDIDSVVSNRIGFDLMYSWLIAYMLECEKKCGTAKNKTIIYFSKNGDKLEKLIDYSRLDISKFDCDQLDLQNYISSNADNPCANEDYVMKRFRDALMHGQLKIEINNDNQLVIAFYDLNKNTQRTKIIKSTIEDLELFVKNTLDDTLSGVDSRTFRVDPNQLN